MFLRTKTEYLSLVFDLSMENDKPLNVTTNDSPSPISAEDRVGKHLEKLSPGYFSFVMATGIVSLALYNQELIFAAQALFALNSAGYIILWILFILRFVLFRRSFIQDLLHHERCAGFLTTVAATCVLGVQFVLLSPWKSVAPVLWLIGCALWIVLNYTFFSITALHEPKPPLDKGINGTWLLAVVSTESIAVLGVLVADKFAQKNLILFVSLSATLIGVLIYLSLITLIFYRWMFFSIKPEKLTPDYWINMGALAITTVAGTMLLAARNDWSVLQDLAPFLTGLTIMAWAAGAWWIPLLLIAGGWKHGWERIPWSYNPNYWAMVFPLGMFSVATDHLHKTLALDFLVPLGKIFAVIATLAWIWVFIGLLLSLRDKRERPLNEGDS